MPAFVACLLASAALSTSALAQSPDAKPQRPDDIIVTGQRASSVYTTNQATSFGYSQLAVKEVPQSIQVLTRDLIDDQGVLSFSELLNNVAGSSNSLGRSTPFGTATTQIRGQDVLLYRDGLRDVDYSDIDNSALNNVERVEVLKGAAGLISGTGGAGGIINIITKRPTDFAQISLAGPGTHLIALERTSSRSRSRPRSSMRILKKTDLQEQSTTARRIRRPARQGARSTHVVPRYFCRSAMHQATRF